MPLSYINFQGCAKHTHDSCKCGPTSHFNQSPLSHTHRGHPIKPFASICERAALLDLLVNLLKDRFMTVIC